MASVFTKIMQGELPSYKIYEDEYIYAFLTLAQIELGHTLVVPKVEVDYFVDVPEPHYSAVFSAGKKISKAIHKATGCKRVGATILGWEVPHFHLHLVPMYGGTVGDMDFSRARQMEAKDSEAIQKKILSELEKL